ncbi:MAG: PEP-CTERM sorting domain-containing protein [Vicinamibacterales bacterium]
MKKLGCFGLVAAALLMSAGTAHADAFTVIPNAQQSKPGVGDLWFNNVIKISGPSDEATKFFLADYVLIFGGDALALPNDTITVAKGGGASAFGDLSANEGAGGGFSHSAAANALASSSISGNSAPATHPGATGPSVGQISFQVPGASAAYDPFIAFFPVLGINIGTNASGPIHPWIAAFVFPGWNALAGNMGVGNGNPGPAATTSAGGDPPVPVTPEPSPLFLLAAGLGAAVVMKRHSFGPLRG